MRWKVLLKSIFILANDEDVFNTHPRPIQPPGKPQITQIDAEDLRFEI
jgi:hypothetical protein